MKHRSTREVVADLRNGGFLVECDEEVDPHLEMAEIQRRVYASGGPAVYFPRVRGCNFPCVSNLFGSLEQSRYLFRHTLERVQRLIELKIDPGALAKRPTRYWRTPLTALSMLPRKCKAGAVMAERCALDQLPAIQSWPDDGGPFVTLPQVLSADPSDPTNLMHVNLGMYRAQLSGNQYVANEEMGLHYQIHRGIGVHHQAAIGRNQPLQVCISVGGSPAMTLAAVMPLPEGLTELTFAGALSGRRIPMICRAGEAPVYGDADFAIVGEILPDEMKPEGPFGDHLGYYSLQHPFPVLRIRHVWHRRDAVWPFTVVGRPPQEDTSFGQLIHELTGPVIPTVIPGVQAVHAVDAAGVHPLLLAIGSERYMPFVKAQQPAEILTQANAILGNGQLSLAKYLVIANGLDAPELDIHDVQAFWQHVLRRVDWRRDLHFQTRTTIDTLDYSGEGLNRGSKLVIAAAGPARRQLADRLPTDLSLPPGYSHPHMVMPGVMVVQADRAAIACQPEMLRDFCQQMEPRWKSDVETGDGSGSRDGREAWPLIVLVDDAEFAARTLTNWLWVTFTRSNPAIDVDGIFAESRHRHWGCRGPLVIDATIKPHHAPPLVTDPKTVARVDALAASGSALARWL